MSLCMGEKWRHQILRSTSRQFLPGFFADALSTSTFPLSDFKQIPPYNDPALEMSANLFSPFRVAN